MITTAQLRGGCTCFQAGFGLAVTGHSLPDMAADTPFTHLFAAGRKATVIDAEGNRVAFVALRSR